MRRSGRALDVCTRQVTWAGRNQVSAIADLWLQLSQPMLPSFTSCHGVTGNKPQ